MKMTVVHQPWSIKLDAKEKKTNKQTRNQTKNKNIVS